MQEIYHLEPQSLPTIALIFISLLFFYFLKTQKLFYFFVSFSLCPFLPVFSSFLPNNFSSLMKMCDHEGRGEGLLLSRPKFVIIKRLGRKDTPVLMSESLDLRETYGYWF